MHIMHFFLFLSSTLLYALPALCSNQLWWFVFVFAIPLFYVALHARIVWWHGFMWSICAAALHLLGVLQGTTSLAQGPFYLAIAPAFFVVMYTGLFGIIMVKIADLLYRFLPLPKTYSTLFAWVSALWCYVLMIDRFSLWPFDVCEGYFLMHPLLPLTAYPQLLSFLPYVGKELLTIPLLATSAVLFLPTIKQKMSGAVFCCLLWTSALFFSYQATHQPLPAWTNEIVVIQKVFRTTPQLNVLAFYAQQSFKKAALAYPDASVFILPEASFYCNHLHDPVIHTQWGSNQLGRSIDILAGAFRWDGAYYRNTFYWVHNGTIGGFFDKTHAMTLTERTPSLFRFSWLHNLYFKNFHEITPSTNRRPTFAITNQIKLVPYICSELFFNNIPDTNLPTTTILAVCNDRWTTNYVKLLMMRAAQFKAIEWQRPIIYVSYAYAIYIHPNGHFSTLAATH